MTTSYDPPSWAGKPLGGLHLDVLKVKFELVLLTDYLGIAKAMLGKSTNLFRLKQYLTKNCTEAYINI